MAPSPVETVNHTNTMREDRLASRPFAEIDAATNDLEQACKRLGVNYGKALTFVRDIVEGRLTTAQAIAIVRRLIDTPAASEIRQGARRRARAEARLPRRKRQPEPPTGETKRCPGCGETKDLNEFWKHRTRADGRQPYCKQCHKEKYLRDRPKRQEDAA